ncbi:MAG: SCP-like protein extracellular [Candidatus Daviesbacteria bacterium GW2011_GWA1_41_61]|uniref:SCP-like protein extracellular n=1 Tax=Candidatus Daviesbacteria bacterium GW2011_GWA2_40_9 TaxID=1618424 RepID=A0A0G0U3Z6_9BACT|nr:MAG: SCP-like protein extracellular [Candidatus Daviesbacteria bacterium GW2011_GWC1_40_9]KKR83794.1 MAG: SCP-like protein extracellular [Candidatus Daviesbacteria bacterium GW2011_GWA2_40_9]KKR93403.1 MAG: SCP-like protein extracellular [Candidatus Daviesbacteria bacterium GW2011_GWB1_41_15]KKS15048.1 MAG: SCP-like protein extracellular [Candidatus Daviesbacteria bacterium GW2011_GWA1_41_61]
MSPNEVNRDFVIDIIDRTNIDRKKVNLQPLKENSALNYAAYLRAKDILDNPKLFHLKIIIKLFKLESQ